MKKRLNLFVFALIAILAVSSISIPMIQAGGTTTDPTETTTESTTESPTETTTDATTEAPTETTTEATTEAPAETTAETTKPTTGAIPNRVILNSVDKNGKENGIGFINYYHDISEGSEHPTFVISPLESPTKEGMINLAYEVYLLDKDGKKVSVEPTDLGGKHMFFIKTPDELKYHGSDNYTKFSRVLADGKEEKIPAVNFMGKLDNFFILSGKANAEGSYVFKIEGPKRPVFDGDSANRFISSFNQDGELNNSGFASVIKWPKEERGQPRRLVAYEVEAKAPSNQLSVAFEMHLADYHGKKMELGKDAKVAVYLHIPEKLKEYAAKDLTLYHVLADGKEEKVEFTVSDDGKMIRFETNSFSVFRLAATTKAEIPETGESSFAYYLAAFAFFALAAFLLVKRIKVKN